jgi:hypothetical protein
LCTLGDMSEHTEHEKAVRRYLQSRRDPSTLLDSDEIERLQQQIDSTADPIEQLRLISQLERAKQVDLSHIEHEFIRCAKQWAEANDISVSAFRNLDVPDATLRAAGLIAGSGRKPGRPKADRSARAPRSSGRSSGNVSIEQVKAHVGSLSERFTLNDVVDGVKASSMTVRKAVTEMVDAGQVRRLGPAQDHAGRGRAPIEYQLVG